VAEGVGLCRDELREMVRGYYKAREWDENGFVPERKLEQLGIACPSVLKRASL
jgi:aldehyde:ferredoxin oxidoreductase